MCLYRGECVCVCVCVHTHTCMCPRVLTETLSTVHSDCEWNWCLTGAHRGPCAGLGERPVGIHTLETIAWGQDKSNIIVQTPSAWSCCWNCAWTMDTHGLMCCVKPAITRNGNWNMKHYASRQKGKCKLILFLFRCKCLSRLVGIQGPWHQHDLVYYNPWKRRALGALSGSDSLIKPCRLSS